MTREEVFYGNLVMGPSFTAWVKKARFYTMQNAIALDTTYPNEEYILPGWQGYDSILPESNHIHWIEEIDDFPWSMLPVAIEFDRSKIAQDMMSSLGAYLPKNIKLVGNTDFLRLIKPTKVYDPNLRRTRMLRELLVDPGTIRPGWVGKRVKIQAMPGGGRDATIASPSTLLKIKYSNELFLQLCERNPYSAMGSHEVQERRMNRIRRVGKIFLHWDFRKVGLCCPRVFFLALGDIIQQEYHMDMSWFDFDDLTVIDGSNVYQTERGYALGWMNEGITLVIIHWFLTFFKKYDSQWKKHFDFVVFNDDVEIAIKQELSWEEMDTLKDLILNHFREMDIPCSIKKIFFSEQSIFLEDYFNPPGNNFNFEKRSIAARLYAKASMNTYHVARKAYVAHASQIWKDRDIVNSIVSTTSSEFFDDELDFPFEAGGWFFGYEHGLSTYTNSDFSIMCAYALGKVKPTVTSTSFRDDFSWEKAALSHDRISAHPRKRFLDLNLPKDEYYESFTTGLSDEYFQTVGDLLDSSSIIKNMFDQKQMQLRDRNDGVG